MNFIIFGPPGVGKSTIIGQLKLCGTKAIDLEDFYPDDSRFSIPSKVDNCFLGGADLDPIKEYKGCKKVLMYMSEKSYKERRSIRDRKHPSKADQKQQTIEQWKDGEWFDIVINAEGPIECVASDLLHLARKYNR